MTIIDWALLIAGLLIAAVVAIGLAFAALAICGVALAFIVGVISAAWHGGAQ